MIVGERVTSGLVECLMLVLQSITGSIMPLSAHSGNCCTVSQEVCTGVCTCREDAFLRTCIYLTSPRFPVRIPTLHSPNSYHTLL